MREFEPNATVDAAPKPFDLDIDGEIVTCITINGNTMRYYEEDSTEPDTLPVPSHDHMQSDNHTPTPRYDSPEDSPSPPIIPEYIPRGDTVNPKSDEVYEALPRKKRVIKCLAAAAIISVASAGTHVAAGYAVDRKMIHDVTDGQRQLGFIEYIDDRFNSDEESTGE